MPRAWWKHQIRVITGSGVMYRPKEEGLALLESGEAEIVTVKPPTIRMVGAIYREELRHCKGQLMPGVHRLQPKGWLGQSMSKGRRVRKPRKASERIENNA